MKDSSFAVISNDRINYDTFDLKLQGDTSEIVRAGQFVNLDVNSVFLRRPISICEWEKDCLRLVYKVVGKGTAIMSEYRAGDKFNVLLPLGNGFDVEKAGDNPLLIGGGVGTPPLLGLGKELKKAGKKVRAVLGFNSAKDMILYDDFVKLLGKENVTVTTVDGSVGVKGFVTDAEISGSFIYACGPIPMLRAVALNSNCGAELSFESRMGCGFGACMGCSMQTKNGSKRVCVEGPVFCKEKIIW